MYLSTSQATSSHPPASFVIILWYLWRMLRSWWDSGSQRTTWRSLFSPFTMWVEAFRLRRSITCWAISVPIFLMLITKYSPWLDPISNTGQSEFSRIQANSEPVCSFKKSIEVKYRSWVDMVTLGEYCGHAHQELQWHPTGDGDEKINVSDTFLLHIFPAQLPPCSLSVTVDVRTNKTGKKSKWERSQPSGTKTPYLERVCKGPLLVRVKWQQRLNSIYLLPCESASD